MSNAYMYIHTHTYRHTRTFIHLAGHKNMLNVMSKSITTTAKALLSDVFKTIKLKLEQENLSLIVCAIGHAKDSEYRRAQTIQKQTTRESLTHLYTYTSKPLESDHCIVYNNGKAILFSTLFAFYSTSHQVL